MTIGRRIREFRKEQGLTLKQLGEIVGISHGSLSDIENEKTKPAATTISSFVQNTDIDPYWLFTGREPPYFIPDIGGRKSRFFSVKIEGEAAAEPPINQLYLDFEEELVLPGNLRKGIGRDKVGAIRVVGKSMEPELRDGDVVVVCKEAPKLERIDPDKLYCVYVEAEKGFVVKRIEYRPKEKELALLPLNPASRVQFIKIKRGKNPIVGWIIAAWKIHFPQPA